jgi:hypothetical protein
MWLSLVLLWIIPLVVGLVLLARVMQLKPLLTDQERHLLFRGDEKTEWSHWFWFKFGALAIVFFLAGILDGLVLVNIEGIWLIAPLVMGVAAILAALFLARNEQKDSLWRLKNSVRPLGRIFEKLPKLQNANKH